MDSLELIRHHRPWNDDHFPLHFVDSGETSYVAFTGGRVSGSAETIATVYESSTSMSDFIRKAQDSELTVDASDTLLLELGLLP